MRCGCEVTSRERKKQAEEVMAQEGAGLPGSESAIGHSAGGRISCRQVSVAVFCSIAETEQYFCSLSSMARFTAASSSTPRRRYSTSSFTHTLGGSAARSPEQITSSDSSFCRFFFRMLTTSVAVHAPRAIKTSSIGPGALFDVRSESIVMVCPEGLVATNFSSPIHWMDAVSILPPEDAALARDEIAA